MKKNLKRSLIFIGFVIVVIAVIFFVKNLFVSTEDVIVNLKWKHQAQFAGMYVANDKGFYKKSGLNVDLREFSFNSDSIGDLLQGNIDFMLMSAEEFLLYIDEGADIRAVAAFYQTSPYSIVSLSEKNIETPAEFLGKTLGNKGGKVEEEIFYLLLLEKFGITRDDVEIIKIGFDKREVDDLTDNDVDTVGLYRTDQLYFFEREGVAYNIIRPERFGINISNDILVTTGSLMEQNPELVDDFVKSTIAGWEHAISDPNEAVDITLKYVIDKNYQDREYEEYILENSIPLIQPSTGQQIGLIRLLSFESLYGVMLNNNFLKTEFDVSDYYTNNFVN